MAKKKQKIVLVGKPCFRVHLSSYRPPVSGFPTRGEAESFVKNNYSFKPGDNKEKIFKSLIREHQRVKKLPSRLPAQL